MALKKRGLEIVGSSDEYEEAVEEITQKKPTLVLLDIQLEGDKDGVDVANYLDKRNINYMFITSQTDPNTIARVKQTNPLGYIVKPFTEAGLLSNIELAWHSISVDEAEFITFKSEGRSYKINQANIQYLKAFDNYCYIIALNKEYLVPHTLKDTAALLNQNHFFQSHRSYWINMRKIVSVQVNSVQVDDIEIPLSYSKKKILNGLL